MILKNDAWIPDLKTILKISEATSMDIAVFLRYAGDSFQGLIGNHTIFPEDISDALRYYRLENELSENQLAQITGFQISAISFRESKRYCNLPSLATLEIYCTAFGISIDEFLDSAVCMNYTGFHFYSFSENVLIQQLLSLK